MYNNSFDNITSTLSNNTTNSDFNASTGHWLSNNYPIIIAGVSGVYCLCCCLSIYLKNRNINRRERLSINNDDPIMYTSDPNNEKSKRSNSILSYIFRKESNNNNNNNNNYTRPEGSFDAEHNNNNNIKSNGDGNDNDGVSCKSEGIVKLKIGGTSIF